MPTGVNLNGYASSVSCVPWHSDNEPMFGPQNSPEHTVSMSLGYSVEFQVRRRAPGEVPSSIRLDHGDILVMDGLAPSEYVHRTCLGCRVLGFTLGNAAHCVLSAHRGNVLHSSLVCARFSRGGSPRAGNR